ncbi:MAG: LysE family translocator [Azospirillaceae bacterium]
MSLDLLLVFIPAAFALNVAPGPNNLLALSNGVRFGFGPAFIGGMGRMASFAAMIVLTVVGLGALLAASSTAFLVIKWVGAAYLVFLGLRLWLTRHDGLDGVEAGVARPRIGQLVRQDAAIAASNPKAILIFTAFFPQFLVTSQPAWPQLATMGAVFLALEVVAVLLYALGGRQAAWLFRRPTARRWFNRGCGTALIGAGAALAFARRG